MHVRADVAFVFAGQAIMKSRQPFDLKWLVVLWNVILAVFSIWGAIAVTPEIYGWIKKKIRKKFPFRGDKKFTISLPSNPLFVEHVMDVGISADLCDGVTERRNAWCVVWMGGKSKHPISANAHPSCCQDALVLPEQGS